MSETIVLISLIISHAIVLLCGMLIGGACINKKEYEYARKLRSYKIRCDFEDFMRDYYSKK